MAATATAEAEPRITAIERAMLTYLGLIGWPPLSRRTPIRARADFRLVTAAASRRPPVRSTRDAIATDGGARVPVRVYVPRTGVDGDRPMLVWFHGGGLVFGDVVTSDGTCRSLANLSGAVVVSVEYRLAPEHPLPAAHVDALAAARWAIRQARSLGADPGRVAVGGDSAGGLLAAHVAERLSREGPLAPALQVLVYPTTDLTFGYADRSSRGVAFVDWEGIDWCARLSLMGFDCAAPDLSPYHVEDLTGLPPALIISAGIDPVRPDGLRYGARLEAAGVPVAYHDHPGALHGFLDLDRLFPAARRARRQLAAAIAALDKVPVGPSPAAEPIEWVARHRELQRSLVEAAERVPPVLFSRAMSTWLGYRLSCALRGLPGEGGSVR